MLPQNVYCVGDSGDQNAVPIFIERPKLFSRTNVNAFNKNEKINSL